MNGRWLPFALSAALLTGCNAGEKAAEKAVEANTPADPPAPVTQPVTPPTVPEQGSLPEGPPRDTPLPGTTDSLAHWDGYGDTRFGMDAAAFKTAWAGELQSDGAAAGDGCHHFWPTGQKNSADLAFMFEGGKFVRYSTERATLVAPGGGKVGMTGAEIDALYAGKVERQPHKYGNGEYLRVRDGGHTLIFETDAKGAGGKVTEWRVGVPPQVDYVEGCS